MTPPPALNLLVSYPYMKPDVIKGLKACGPALRFLLDCGAYTAWSSGNPVNLDEYCRFLENPPVPLWRYFALDVIGDGDATLRNYETMLKRGFNPLPIFTPGDPLAVMDRYYETSDVVGVGGLNALGSGHNYVRTVYGHAAGRKLHLLGYATVGHIKALRPYMCDASTWEAGARFAQLNLYMGNGRMAVLDKSDFVTRPPAAVVERIRGYGYDPAALAKAAGWAGGYSVARRLCGVNMTALSIDVERNLGTKLFLACNTGVALNILRRGMFRNTRGSHSGRMSETIFARDQGQGFGQWPDPTSRLMYHDVMPVLLSEVDSSRGVIDLGGANGLIREFVDSEVLTVDIDPTKGPDVVADARTWVPLAVPTGASGW